MIEEIPKVNFSNQQLKNAYLGEAYFLRAYTHWFLFLNFRNIPLMKELPSSAKDYKPQATPEEAWDFIISAKNRYLKGKNIKSMKPLQLRRSISTLFQDSKPFPLSIENNILYPIEFYEGKVKNRKERISNYLKDVNLYNEVKDDFKMSALKLSGGQKQRLCIARMLTTDPDILIFDEPCSSLDMENTLIIEKLIKRLSEKYTVILTTHNEEQAKRIADRTILIGK